MIRKIKFYKNYFVEFYSTLNSEVQEKIEFVLYLIRTLDVVPTKFLKHIKGTNGLYEIRIKVKSDIYRVFCCFDKGKIVILFNGFQKKSQKSPKSVMNRALKLKQNYFEEKEEK